MLFSVFMGIVVGLASGVLADFILVRYGRRPAVMLAVAYCAGVWLLIAWSDLEILDAVPVLVAFGMTGLVAEPLLRKRIHH